MRHIDKLAVGAVVLAALFLSACEDDPQRPSNGGDSKFFLPLTSRSAVLNNLEVGWTQRRTDKVEELLDDDFVFFFAPGDVGGNIPPSWSRVQELAATQALFTSNSIANPNVPVCTSVRVDLLYDPSAMTWVEVPAPFGETWYRTTVFYTFTFQVEPDLTLIAQNGARAEFTVREVDMGSGTEWRLVEWRDLGALLGTAQDAGTAEYTWGSVKFLYYRPPATTSPSPSTSFWTTGALRSSSHRATSAVRFRSSGAGPRSATPPSGFSTRTASLSPQST